MVLLQFRKTELQDGDMDLFFESVSMEEWHIVKCMTV